MEELNIRKNHFYKYKMYGGIFCVFSFPLFILTMTYYEVHEVFNGSILPLVFFVTVVLVGRYLLKVGYKGMNQVSLDFKNQYIKPEIEKRIPGATYNPCEGVEIDMILESNLFSSSRFNIITEDLIEGDIRGVHFVSSDVFLKPGFLSNKNTVLGRFFEFEFSRPFASDVILLRNGSGNPFANAKEVKLDNDRFNLHFNAYSINPNDAFYILTPHLMEKLIELNIAYNHSIRFSFSENKLFVVYASGLDTFDVKNVDEISDVDIEKGINAINDIIEFVEFLKLDKNIFTSM